MIDLAAFTAGAGLATAACAAVARTREYRRGAAEPAGLADLLPYAALVAERDGLAVIAQKDGALLAGLRVRGPDVGTMTAAETAALAAHLTDALNSPGDGWCLHVDAIRSPAPPPPAGRFPDPVTAWIDAERRAALSTARPQFVTETTLCVTYLPPRETYSRAARLFTQRGSGERRGAAMLDATVAAFSDAVAALARRLGSRLTVAPLDSAALVTHIHRCLTALPHAVNPPAAALAGAWLDYALASVPMTGGNAPVVGELTARVVALTGYPRTVSVGALDMLGALPFPLRFSTRYVATSPRTAAAAIGRAQTQWFMGRRGVAQFARDAARGNAPRSAWKEQEEAELFHDRDATDMTKDGAAALAENASGAVRFGYLTQCVVVADPDPAVALRRAESVVTAAQDRGFAARVETVNAVDAFFGTLPGVGAANLRRPMVSTANLAALMPATSVWPGLAFNPSPFFPPETPPLLTVATQGATPFRLHLHVGDVGHTLVVGQTGGGKTTAVGVLLAAWRRYQNARTAVFDVGGGHRTLALATGAAWYALDAGGMNGRALAPLADVDDPAERAWAVDWLETLVALQHVTVTPAHRAALDRALALVAAQPRACRTLSELALQVQDRDLAAALRPYTHAGPHGALLDGSADDGGGDSGAARHAVYELRALLDLGDAVLVPVLLTLFHAVERSLDGGPALLVVEEVWAALARTVFADRLRAWLLTLRKRNAAVCLVAHSLAQLDAVPAKQLFLESCPTRILLPNPEAASPATAPLYRALGLTDGEIATVAAAVPKRDYYVKTSLGARLVSLDVGPLALAFVGSPSGFSPDEARAAVDALAARDGAAWPAAWLRALGVEVPAVEGGTHG